MQAVNFIRIKLFYYLDPYGPSRGVRSVYTALVLVVLIYNYHQRAYLLPAAPYYRKYFKMRFESLEKDKLDIEAV